MLWTIQEYVLGFCFNKAEDSVVLMCKNRPDWQAGSFNGIGGKIESGETRVEAMIREFEEETGVSTIPADWTECIEMSGIDWKVHIFKATNSMYHDNAKTTTDEDVFKVGMRYLDAYKLIDNLKWVIPMLRDDKVSFPLKIDYDMKQFDRMANCEHDWIHEKIELDLETLQTISTARRVCKKCGLCMGIDMAKESE